MTVPYDSATRWQPDRTPSMPNWPQPPMSVALFRGACNRCPACGETRLFRKFLKVTPVCSHCSAPLGLARADDAPPYFTILLVAHIIVPLMFWLERAREPPLWVHAAIWLPLTVVLCVGLLQPIKGATVGLMLKLGMLKTDIDDR
jgi:uncharacterized protein (DUF983 family)